MRQVLPVVGGIVGAYFGGPQGAQIGFAIGSLIGNAVDPLEVQGNKLGDAPTQTAGEGGARAIVFGKGCVRAVVVIERGGRRVVKQRDQSGKGGGPVTVNERALWTYAIGIGEAIPDGGLLRIWENEKLVYDVTPDSNIVKDSAEFAKLFRFYDGAEDQLPDPAIEAIYTDPTDAPYYRGTAYIVFPQRDLTDFGEAVPTYRVEVSASAQTTDLRMVAFKQREAGDYTMLLDQDYSGSWVSGYPILDGVNQAINVGERILAWGNGSVVPRYSDDAAANWAVGGGSFGVYSTRTAAISGDTIIIPGVLNAMNRSLDRGTNWAPIAGSPASSAIARAGSRWVSASLQHGTLRYSDHPAGDAWSDWVSLGAYIGMEASWSDGPTAYFGGTRSSPSYPAIIRTTDGESFAPETLPVGLDTSASVRAISGHDGVMVAGLTTGEILRKQGGVWAVVYTAGGPVNDIKHNGLEFVAIGGTGSVGDGFILTSPDGLSWTTRVSSALVYNENWNALAVLPYNPVSVGEPIPLSAVIAALHDRCGHAASDYDVTAMPDLIDGVVIESTQTGAEAINSIVGTHWADASDYDGQIHYIKRGRPVVRTLTIDDLIDEPETWQRNNAIEYPAKMHFFGQIAELAYASVKATSARYSADVKVVGEASVASPETFNTSQRPYEIAAILHKIMWTEAGGEVTWRVTDQHLDLVPTDCVGLSWAGQLWRARITQIESDPGELKIKMMLDRQSAYTANLTAIPIPPPPTPPQTGIVSDTALAVMDIPALVDAADDLHIVTAMSGETDAWAGGTLQRSLDDGASFATVSSSTLNAIMGTLQAPVTAASPHYTDTTNVVEVLLYMDDEIEAISEQAFLSEGGAFALSWDDGGTRRWELMQYRDAELIAPKTYRLTTLHRGQLNTEAAAHPTNAVFVLLDAAIQRQAAQSAWIGTDLTHRAVSNGQTPDGADEQTLTYAGNSQREFPVAHLILSRAGDDVTATAVPRHRFGTDDAPIRSLNWDGYRWTATDGANTVTRDGTAETETFDCTGWASPVSVTVAQLNRITGAGPTVTEGIA